MQRILIIQTAFLGDVILATPVVSELHRLYPDAKIDFLVKKGNESLLSNNPKLNQVYVFDKSKKKLRNMRSLWKQFRSNQYDLCVNLHRFGSSGIIAKKARAKELIGFDSASSARHYDRKVEHAIGNGKHEVERNLSTISHLGANPLVRPELFPSDDDFRKVQSLRTDQYFCLAPASVWFTKQFPEDRWQEIIDQLDGTIYLLGGPDDKALCNRIASSSSKDIVVLAGELSLMQSTALMKDAKRNYVNDSGPLHLASSQNAPVTALFCSTVPSFGFGPLSEDSQILEVSTLECRPCGLHGHKSCPKGHFDCSKFSLTELKS